MVRVAPINLTFNPRTLWFDPGDLEIAKDDPVVVRTARGTEFGIAASEVIEVSEEQVRALKSALRPVERIATEEDVERAREMEEKSREALPVFKEMAREAHEDMHPVSVEFLLDGDKAVFYFEAEERIDFRELVRKLASRFHVRIDMRQIGVRDEARMVGGVGHCGQELCCKRLGGEFCPVSIRMAKEQGLSLNPQKISGLCGRLMCCLRYEFDAYKDFKGRAPKLNGTVTTPAGPAKVVDHDVPREIVSLKVEGEKPVKVPLADFDPAPEGAARPNTVGEEAWERATTEHGALPGESLIFSTSQFTGSDKLAEGAKVRHTGGGRKAGEGRRSKGSSSDRGRSKRSGGRGDQAAAPAAPPRKRRRSTKLSAGDDGHGLERVSTSRDESAGDTTAPKPRRSRRSKDGASRGGEQGACGSQGQSRSKDGKGAGAKGASGTGAGKPRGGARPGQKSSGLAAGRPDRAEGGAPANKDGEAPRKPRRRRRSRKPKGDGGGTGGGQPTAQGGAE
ncbi:regulatory iron-sulfur-containing complex subunit RicT [Adlercreutzia sp. R7]|uniref:Regulatory iron-sulfur-containing complex subunit RicT n=1 Tax=Adlercreutzia wanghongyangiae TaxID=3111451 RepID=A0ABU6IJS9_9ACTN|nr:regulatory iron-sulfur-containing complex subunit RicT [Adlercreutzia sp. R7]